MSESHDALPPKSAPLSEKLAAAMAAAGYESARGLATDLETDGSLVGKWLNGDVSEIKSLRHQQKLPELLGVPQDYFAEAKRPDRLRSIEEEAREMRLAVLALLRIAVKLAEEVEGLGGRLPAGAIQELVQVGLRMQDGGP